VASLPARFSGRRLDAERRHQRFLVDPQAPGAADQRSKQQEGNGGAEPAAGAPPRLSAPGRGTAVERIDGVQRGVIGRSR